MRASFVVGALSLLVACTASPPTEPVTTPTDPSGTVDPNGDCSATVSSVAEHAPPAALQRGLTVTLSEPAALWTVCTPADDAEEALLVESTAVTDAHELVVHGLYAGTSWTCEITPACAGARSHAHDLDPVDNPSSTPSYTVTGTPTSAFTLFNVQAGGSHSVVVVDPEGRVRWSLPVDSRYVLDVDVWWTGEVMHLGGGWGLFDESASHRGFVRQVDLSGTPVFESTTPVFGLGYNHHSEPMPDGTILSLTTSTNTLGDAEWHGVAVERLDPTTNTVTWSWDSQTLVDAGLEGPFQVDSPWHANALHWTTDPGGEAVWISLFAGQAVWRVDPSTGERTHVFGAEGDFTLVDAAGAPLGPAEWPYAQHGIDVTADGRILLYDNGNDRPGGEYSRVSEYRLDLESNVATLLWSWTEPGWFTPIVGDADYLPSGNVLIAKGVVQFLTFNGQPSAIIEVDPSNDEVVWRLEFDNQFDSIFRAHRYSGCDLFRSARHCADVADRVGVLRGSR